jgi:ribosomal protein S18 acetylase RimI-like enzyme
MTDADAREIVASAAAMQARCVYFLSDDAAAWRAAITVGFEPIDIRIELLLSSPPAAAPRTLASPDDEPELLAIVRENPFEHSRFFRDPRFGREKAAELFELWRRRGLEDHQWFTVIEEGGFVTCSESAIQLVAVASRARGRGVGRRLIAGALAELASRGAEDVTVVTQGSNIAAQRLYAGSGFRPTSCALWLHRWSDV